MSDSNTNAVNGAKRLFKYITVFVGLAMLFWHPVVTFIVLSLGVFALKFIF